MNNLKRRKEAITKVYTLENIVKVTLQQIENENINISAMDL